MGGEAGRGFIDQDIDKDDPVRISLCLVSQQNPSLLYMETQPTEVPAGRKNAFDPGTYRVTVRLYSANTSWAEKQFLIHHTGEWNHVSISDA